jgi:hypothetical protein
MPKIFPIKHAIPYFAERERECVCVCAAKTRLPFKDNKYIFKIGKNKFDRIRLLDFN